MSVPLALVGLLFIALRCSAAVMYSFGRTARRPRPPGQSSASAYSNRGKSVFITKRERVASHESSGPRYLDQFGCLNEYDTLMDLDGFFGARP